MVFSFFFLVTSVAKSQSGDGVRRFESFTDGDELGSSGITANRPRCTHGDVGPYVPTNKVNTRMLRIVMHLRFKKLYCKNILKLRVKKTIYFLNPLHFLS